MTRDALYTLTRLVRQDDSDKKLDVVLSVVAPQSTDLGKVKMGTLFTKFREEGNIGLQRFVDYLPPVSVNTNLHNVEADRMSYRACNPTCLCWQCKAGDLELGLIIPHSELSSVL